MQPRSATGYGVGILTRVLARLELAVDGAVDRIAALRDQLEKRMEAARNLGIEIAGKLKGATPVVYSTEKYANVARIWKIKFNENSKTPAFWNFLPELNHNELIGWTDPHGQFHLVFLSDPEDDPRNLKRQRISQQVLEEKGLTSTVVTMEGEDKVEKMFSTLLVGDWASWALALELGHDPSPVPLVEEFKARMKDE
jgi:glucose/mannose-6-phosphate isomerase